MRSLITELNQAADAYYNGRGELMTDYEWDAKFDQLKALEQETGTVLPDSPTHKVSEDNIAGQKEEHEFPTLSLAKTKKPEELAKWAEGRPVWLSWKLDGLTLVATYDGGRLTKVVTRGNGHTGTNITHLARAIGGIPQSIPSQGHIVIRGEAVISYDDFERFNMESEEEYANPRNLASGSLTLKDPEEVKARRIRWIPFTLVYADDDIDSWGARMDFLEQNGFHTVEHELIGRPTLEHIEEVIARWTEKVTHRVCPYPVDGLVITYDDTAYARTGSVTGHHATRAGYAFKWQDESAETQLEHIEWSCAANTINPVAVFRPVELEGTTVRRASLCNISECERLGIGGKGSVLSVIKANKIIPKVIRVSQPVGPFLIPGHCPVCRQPTEVAVSEASGTKTLRCTNPDCPARQLKKFVRFVSKEGMDIDGISEQTLAKFINLGWVSEPTDLYHLRDHAAELSRMEGFGERSVHNLLRSVESSRKAEARKLLYALTIPMCGQDVCKRLLAAYPLTELIGEAERAQDPAFFATIDGIGPEKSASFVRWCQDGRNTAMLRRLLGELELRQEQASPTGARCAGLTFVVTGDVYQYKNREELKAYIESQGGKVTGSVSKATDYLINNDANSTSGKNQKARQLGTPIISEAEFIEKFGEGKEK
ncbi:NAD-dependent DNA ligase LigA [Prevotella sp. oral taxon 376]|nr:NAD-dependent DNA ligase LigA [Prevotella sp. oral taxon 376]